jgi:hypothetical protein
MAVYISAELLCKPVAEREQENSKCADLTMRSEPQTRIETEMVSEAVAQEESEKSKLGIAKSEIGRKIDRKGEEGRISSDTQNDPLSVKKFVSVKF